MAGLQEVPIVDLQSDNIQELWPTLLLAVRTSAFVAVDTELSGLGNRRQLNAKAIDDRYLALANIARTRSILSVGISCFKLEKQTATNKEFDKDTDGKRQKTGLKFVTQTFNILMLCSEDYIVEPLSLRFLVNHNFDFNRQYAKGIPYYRGCDQEKAKDRQWLRELVEEIRTHKIPIVFHNALVDLGFLYQSFHTNLPNTIGSFLADLTEVFPGGIFDTKYITEFQARFTASYLEYVFRKCQRDNHELFTQNKDCLSIKMLTYPPRCTFITYLPCNILTSTNNDQELCMTYAGHGWCAEGVNCSKSHDINLILDADEKHLKSTRKKRKRKAKKGKHSSKDEADMEEQKTATHDDMDIQKEDGDCPENADSIAEKSDLSDAEQTNTVKDEEVSSRDTNGKSQEHSPSEKPVAQSNQNRSRTEGHRAGFDSFMTGFIFAYFTQRYGKWPGANELMDLGMSDFVNKITLSGKDIPLRIVQSSFSKTSKEHRQKLEKSQSMVT